MIFIIVVLSVLIGILTSSIALSMIIWLMQDSLSFKDFVDTFKVCLVFNAIVTGADTLTWIFTIVAVGVLGGFGAFLSLLVCLAAFIFSFRLLMSWGGFGVSGAIIVTVAAGFIEWLILTGSIEFLQTLLP
jgi:hypothetical protein